MAERKLILIELNEINFDVVKRYVDADATRFPALRRLLSGPGIRTSSEKQYENLEPWIQWPSVHSGLSFEEHGVFRLGDMVSGHVPQMFEQLEQQGWRVGVISAMNAVNRLTSPSYFIPDPWTATLSDGSWWSRVMGEAISQVVNDNSQARITLKSALHLVLGVARFARPGNYLAYLRLALGSRRASWRKALFLDLFLHDLHMRLYQSRRPNFSTLFVNAGAHIQHHYFLNAEPIRAQAALRNPSWYVSPDADPVAEMLEIYDRMLNEYMDLSGTELCVATGLSQRPYDRVKFYYRLKDHAAFLRLLGVRFNAVAPRMTRDFLIEFGSAAAAADAQSRLAGVTIVGKGDSLFEEIDNRGDSLFVTLTYSHEIDEQLQIESDGVRHFLAQHVVFVAVKNGMHQENGFAYFSSGLVSHAPKDGAHVKELYSSIMSYFNRAPNPERSVA